MPTPPKQEDTPESLKQPDFTPDLSEESKAKGIRFQTEEEREAMIARFSNLGLGTELSVTIPAEIREAAKIKGVRNSTVSAWFGTLLSQHGIPQGTSPADLPGPIWEVFKTLQDAPYTPEQLAEGKSKGLAAFFDPAGDTPAS